MTSILKALDSAKSTKTMFKDTITELSLSKECLTSSEANYLNKMTGMSFGTVTACLSKVEQFKEDSSRCNYDTLDQVFYSLKNFTLNKLQNNVTYTCWQDCWNSFTEELVSA